MIKRLVCPLLLCVPLSAQMSRPCTQLSVISQDTLGNIREGLSPADQKWFRDKVEKKYPSVCYVAPSPAITLVLRVADSTYQTTRVVRNTESHPIEGEVRDSDGNTADISATEKTSTTTVVPEAKPIYMLTVELRQPDGSYRILHRIRSYGSNAFLGLNPHRPALEEAAKWINGGGLTEQMSLTAPEANASKNRSGSPEGSSAPVVNSQVPSVALLEVSSNPTGAAIEIDGAYVGDTPAAISVSPGGHSIALSKSGFAKWERKINAMPGRVSISPDLESTNTQKPD